MAGASFQHHIFPPCMQIPSQNLSLRAQHVCPSSSFRWVCRRRCVMQSVPVSFRTPVRVVPSRSEDSVAGEGDGEEDEEDGLALLRSDGFEIC